MVLSLTRGVWISRWLKITSRDASAPVIVTLQTRKTALGGMGQWFFLGWLHFEQWMSWRSRYRSLVAELFLAASQADLGLQRERSAAAAAAAVVSSIGQIHFQEVGFWPGLGGRIGIPLSTRQGLDLEQKLVAVSGVFFVKTPVDIVNGPSAPLPLCPSAPIISGLLEGALGSVRARTLRWARENRVRREDSTSKCNHMSPSRVETMPATFRCINRS